MTMIARTLAATGTLFLSLGVASHAFAQNPVPFIDSLSPTATEPGTGQDLELTIRGGGFSPAAKVNFNGTSLTPNGVKAAQLTVTVPATSLEVPSTANVTVVNPNAAPLVGVSNVAYLPIRVPANVVSTTRKDLPEPGATFGESASVGDFNGDGKLDIAMANTTAFGDLAESEVHILLGDGTGNFISRPKVNFPGNTTFAPTVLDFNGDGKLDLAVQTYTQFADGRFCEGSHFFFGDGSGNLAIGQSTECQGLGFVRTAVGDFNSDGKLDLVGHNRGETDFAILLGDGTGNFSTGPTLNVSIPFEGMAAGDFNGDGKLDLVSVSQFPLSVFILAGDGTGHFVTGPDNPLNKIPTRGVIAVSDFNRDGKLDLAVPNEYDGTVSISLGDGTGTFTTSSIVVDRLARFSYPITLAAGDFNGDGKMDVTAGGDRTISVLLGDGTGAFTTAPDLAASALSIAAADFNGDGRLDLLVELSGISIQLQTTPGPAPEITPSTLAVGSHYVGRWINSYLTLTNIGTSTLNVTSSSLTPDPGTRFDDFRPDLNTCAWPNPVAPGETCSIHVPFKASDAGPKSATLTIWDNAGSGAQTVHLTGTGVAHTPVRITPPRLDFGSHHLYRYINSWLAVTNLDPISLYINAVTVAPSDHFGADLRWCQNPVAPGGTCWVHVFFRAVSPGPKSAELTITDIVGTEPQTVPLTGTGIAGP
jgi:hypothetical protein